MDTKQKKDLIAQYKNRKQVGGVYLIRNTASGKIFVDASTDLQGSRNHFEFSQKTNSCVSMKLQQDWLRLGGGAFIWEALEELEKGETQTPQEFAADVALLLEIWQEKLQEAPCY